MAKCYYTPKFTTMIFKTSDNDPIHIVGRKDSFENKESFLKHCLNYLRSDLERDIDEELFTPVDIGEAYVRYFNRFPGDFAMTGGGYAFCENKQGAFAVYVFDID